jgi:putative CocE/NonD family hydrolase
MGRTRSYLKNLYARRIFSVIVLGLLLGAGAFSQGRDEQDLVRRQLEYTRSHYTKYDYRIPMRDGIKLFTTVYVPKDTSQAYPILLNRTPYSIGPYGIDNYRPVIGPSEVCEKEGFIFVYQDVRGRYLSEGVFVDMPYHKTKFSGPADTDESTDTYDTIDWLVKNVPNNNGRVGIYGISYPGFFAAFGMINAHPALKAASPQAPVGDVANGDDAFHNGAFFLAANFGFYSFFKPRPDGPERPERRGWRGFDTPDAYDFYLKMGPLSNSNDKYLKNDNSYWNANLEHPNYDEFWEVRSLVPHMKNITPAVLFVGGWFDAEDLAGPLKLFQALEKNGPLGPNTLVMGPWLHGGWSDMDGDRLGNLRFGTKTGEFYRENIELPFFVYHLKGKGDGLKSSKEGAKLKAWVFATGTNEWRKFETWPPREAKEKTIYLQPGGKLSFDPAADEPGAFDEYISDPSKPVPVIGYIGEGMPGDYMTEDQRFASRRPDVLVYETEPLDHDVVITGQIAPVLKVSTSGTDSDFVVKLIDVYPNDYPDLEPNPAAIRMGGYQQLVRGEPFRGKFRRSLEKPEPFVPDQPEKIEFAMPDVCHVFRPGHRIMIQIQSSWFPLTDRNPQKFMDIPKAKEADFGKAVERVYRGGADGSRIRLLVLE